MSGDTKGSREAQSSSDAELANEINMMSRVNIQAWAETPGNLDALKAKGGNALATFTRKWEKFGLEPKMLKVLTEDQPTDQPTNKAPAFISQQAASVPPPAPESMDIVYLTQAEYSMGTEFNTLRTRLIQDPMVHSESHTGPWVEVCVGRDPETRKMRVVRLPAKLVPILPEQVIHYRGSVIMDKQAVRKEDVVIGGKRHGYIFDRFYEYNGKKYARCCLVDDRVHQAGLIYQKVINPKTRRAEARLKRIPGGGDDPAYQVIGAKEQDYRDLKRLYERYFLGSNDRGMDDPALGKLIDEYIPERSSLSL